jgi:hypothetical protein
MPAGGVDGLSFHRRSFPADSEKPLMKHPISGLSESAGKSP